MKKRYLMAAPIALVAVAMAGGPALAHDCYIINRNVNFVGQQGSWFGIDVNEAVAADVEAGAYTAEQGACLTDRLPDRIALKIKGANGSEGVLGLNNPNEFLLSNGKGVETIGATFAACGIEFED